MASAIRTAMPVGNSGTPIPCVGGVVKLIGAQSLKPDPPLLFGQLSVKVALPEVTAAPVFVMRM